jgi:hypothetical protein
LEENSFIQSSEAKKKDLLNLKHTIDHNKEILQTQVSKNQFIEKRNKETLEKEKKEILERGENPNFYIPRKIKLDEFERQKQKFENEQRINKQQIAKKILNENQNLEKKKKMYPNLFNINLKPIKPMVNNRLIYSN